MNADNTTSSRLLYSFLALIGAVYLLQTVSLLQLNSDVIYLLEVASSVADGNGFYTLEGEISRYPPGYPALLSFLEMAGLATSWMFIALNCAFIALGIVASFFFLRQAFDLDDQVALLLCTLILLSFVLVKHATLALTDVPFFGVAMAATLALASLRHLGNARRWWARLLLAALLAALSISIRAIGIAFIPALLWALFAGLRKNVAFRKHHLIWVISVAGVCLVLFFGPWNQLNLSILSDALAALVQESTNALLHLFIIKPLAWGELLLNLPRMKFPVPWTVTLPIFLVAGYAGLLTVVYAIWKRRSQFGPVEVLMLTYIGIMILWYGANVRFWLPTLPLILGWITVVVQEKLERKLVRRAVAFYLLWFMVTGCAALVYSSRISLASPSEFIARYGTGSLGPTYELALTGVEPTGTEKVRRRALTMLIRYERRIHPRLNTEDIP